MKPILECKGLTKQYNNHVNALTNLNLVLERGQIIGLLGPNGSGKTTLIKLINDLLLPKEGQVLIQTYNPHHYASTGPGHLHWHPVLKKPVF